MGVDGEDIKGRWISDVKFESERTYRPFTSSLLNSSSTFEQSNFESSRKESLAIFPQHFSQDQDEGQFPVSQPREPSLLANKRTSPPSFSPSWPLCFLAVSSQLLPLSPSRLWRRASLVTAATLVLLLVMSSPLMAALATTRWRPPRGTSPQPPRPTDGLGTTP